MKYLGINLINVQDLYIKHNKSLLREIKLERGKNLGPNLKSSTKNNSRGIIDLNIKALMLLEENIG